MTPQVVPEQGGLALTDAVTGVEFTPSPAVSKGASRPGRLAVILTALALAVTLVAVEAPAPAQAATSEADAVLATARNQLGKPFRLGTEGMRRYDCSGLVYRVFERNGLLKRIGGKRMRAAGYLRWFRDRGLASRYNPRRGDLVVWGDAKHIGLYIGDGRALSALTSGVSRHSIKGINVRFTTYLHVKLSR